MGEAAAVDERVFRVAISYFATGVPLITTLADGLTGLVRECGATAGRRPLVYFRSGLCSAPAYLRLRR
jgi:hypothetical protein